VKARKRQFLANRLGKVLGRTCLPFREDRLSLHLYYGTESYVV
jgi:hypothetical protein